MDENTVNYKNKYSQAGVMLFIKAYVMSPISLFSLVDCTRHMELKEKRTLIKKALQSELYPSGLEYEYFLYSCLSKNMN